MTVTAQILGAWCKWQHQAFGGLLGERVRISSPSFGFEMSKTFDFSCLRCSLPDCDEASPLCLVQIERREYYRRAQRKSYHAMSPERRAEYRAQQAAYREKNRDRERANASKRLWRARRKAAGYKRTASVG
jgi:hypothetical protein